MEADLIISNGRIDTLKDDLDTADSQYLHLAGYVQDMKENLERMTTHIQASLHVFTQSLYQSSSRLM